MPETVSLQEHLEKLRAAEAKFQEERDRRYTEVNAERERALGFKEEADRRALALARAIQDYKDERANDLREQLGSQAGTFATNKDLEPIKAFIASQTGRGIGMNALAGWLVSLLMASVAISALFLRH